MDIIRQELESTSAPGLSIRTLAKKTGLRVKAVSAICHKNFQKADPGKFGSGKMVENFRCFTVN